MDYGAVSTTLRFDACQRQKCVNISIQNDGVLEQLESFFVNLARTPELDCRITLDPVDGDIEILDFNGKFVYSFVHYLNTCEMTF